MKDDNDKRNVFEVVTAESQSPVAKWHYWLQIPEVWIIAFSVICFVVLALWYGGLMLGSVEHGHKKAGVLLGTVAAHLVGGVIPGVSACAGSVFYSAWENILINMLVSSGIVCLVYGFFCLSCRKLFRISFLESAFQSLQKSADSQKKTWVRLGVPGIFLFVWIPFFMTGPIIGSILGRMIGLGIFVNLFTVIFASLTSIMTWVFFWDRLSRFIGEVWLEAVSVGLVSLILLYFLFARIREIYRGLKKGT
ncbi:MAG: small multi-drug export protein [Lentisphaeria bacterium]